MQAENDIFLFYEAEKQLFDTARTSEYNVLTPEKIDREMQFPKSASALHIHCLSQQGLEHFVRRYGGTYRTLYLDDCRRITDFSPLGELANLEALCIEWCRNTDRLWDMSGNRHLKILSIRSAKKLVQNPSLLQTSKTLEEIRLWGGASDGKYHMESLECFRAMQSLRRIDLNYITLDNHSMDVLSTLPNLEEFHFDAGMLTTEEIAWICAKHPLLYGQSLGAYSTSEIGLSDVRVCGARKPGLNLPADQKKLEKYIAQFDELVRKYRNESNL